MLAVDGIDGFVTLKTENLCPDGTAKVYLHKRRSAKGSWQARVSVGSKQVPITIALYNKGRWKAVQDITPKIVALVKDGYAAQAIRNALANTLVPDEMAALVKGKKVSARAKAPVTSASLNPMLIMFSVVA